MAQLTPVQRRLLRIEGQLQRLIGEGAAALFRDARRLADDGFGLETQAALVWHCAREIESAIRAALNPLAPIDERANESQKHAAQVAAIIKELALPETDAAIAWWKKSELEGLAHRPNLGSPRAFTPGDWQTFLTTLELILSAFEARYQRMLDRLDALLAMTPSTAGRETKRLLCIVPPTGQATALRHFFEHADARWLNVLPRCILNNPPGRIYLTDPLGGYWFPAWHASKYLAKVAPEHPSQVFAGAMRVLAKAPENPWIHMDFIDAASHFPVAMMAEWAKAEAAWVGAQPRLDMLLSKDFAKATQMLAEEGLVDEAFAMGQAVLALGEGASRRHDEPSLRTHEYEYGEALRIIALALTEIDARRTSEILIGLVDQAVEQANSEGRAKWSRLWRSSIADDGTNEGRHILDKLIDALRDALERAAGNPAALVALHEELASRATSSPLFSRLAIHIATKGREVNRALAIATAMDPATYTSDTWVEAYRLIEAVGLGLDGAEIDATLVAIRSSLLDDSKRDQLIEVVEGLRLGAVAPPLVGHRWFSVHRYVPPPSPVSAQQIARWSVPRTVRFITQRQADAAQRRDDDSLEFAFLEVVKANPSRWSDAGVKVVGLPPDFLVRYLAGLREATREGATLNGNALARLLEAGLITGRQWHLDAYADARKSAAWLLRDSLDADRIGVLSPKSRSALWAVVGALLSDRSPVSVSGSGADLEDLAMSALNQTRSISATVVVAYARWLARQRPGTRRLPTQARLLLEARLDPAETSPAVRFAIGEQLAALWWLDPAWTAGILPRVLPTEATQAAFRDAAWSGYLWRGNVPLDFFRTLLPEYRRAVESLDPDAAATKAHERLADHVLLLARIGTIGPESDDGLLGLLLHHAPASLARQAIHEVSWSVYDSREQPIDPDEAARLRLLWEWLAGEVAAGSVDAGVLEPFGWWFASGQFDQDWSLNELERLANADVGFEFLKIVFERLHALVAGDPARIGRVTEAVVSHEIKDQELHSDDLPAIVRALLDEQSGPVASQWGHALVSRMRSRGFARFPEG